MNENYILSIIASLCLCDHMGDVADVINKVLKDLDFDAGEWYSSNDWDSDLLDALAKHKVTTLYGTLLEE